MNFWGLFNYDFGMGMNNWFTPNYSFYTNPFFNNSSFFNYQPLMFDYTSNIWNFTPTYSFTPEYSYTPTIRNFGFFNTTPTVVETKKAATEDEVKEKKQTPALKLNFNNALDGYNANAGQRLANIALNNSVGWTGYCATHVKKAISQANLGSYQYGHAYQMPSILRNNKNFKEIPADSVDVKDLPAGCVLVYGKGEQGYSSTYGHIEITTGDGRAVSDGITRHLYKQPTSVFIPVERNYMA